MKLLIAGAGISGSYLYRLLLRQGFPKGDITLSDIQHFTQCGQHPCAWGVGPQIFPLLKDVGLDPWNYILTPGPLISLDGELVKSHLWTINKPSLLHDLTDSQLAVFPQDVSPDGFDRIIDCTGSARVFSPPLAQDIKANLSQARYACHHYVQPAFRYHKNIGYSWAMPLLGAVHVGSGGLKGHELPTPGQLGVDCGKEICRCTAQIRLTGPVFPLVNGKVWTVGEAAGIVEPLFGAGIISAMLSARALVENWDDPKGYEARVKQQMGLFIQNGDIVRRLLDGKVLGLRQFPALWRTMRYHGFAASPRQLFRLLRLINASLQ